MDDHEDIEMDLQRSPDDLADRFELPRAYIQAAISAGCPTADGLLSHTDLITWIHENCGAFRASLGLAALPTAEGLSEGLQAHQRVANTLRTLGDYMLSRGSTEETKTMGALMVRTIEEASAKRYALDTDP